MTVTALPQWQPKRAEAGRHINKYTLKLRLRLRLELGVWRAYLRAQPHTRSAAQSLLSASFNVIPSKVRVGLIGNETAALVLGAPAALLVWLPTS